MANSDLKKLAKENGVCLWQVAQEYGVTDGNFSRKLRREFSSEEKAKVRSIIEALKAGVANG